MGSTIFAMRAWNTSKGAFVSRNMSCSTPALYSTALHYTALPRTALNCTALHCTALQCNTLHYTLHNLNIQCLSLDEAMAFGCVLQFTVYVVHQANRVFEKLEKLWQQGSDTWWILCFDWPSWFNKQISPTLCKWLCNMCLNTVFVYNLFSFKHFTTFENIKRYSKKVPTDQPIVWVTNMLSNKLEPI